MSTLNNFVLGCTGGKGCLTGFYTESKKGSDLKGSDGQEWVGYRETTFDRCWKLASLAQAKFFSWTAAIYSPGYCKISTACSEASLSNTTPFEFKLYECSGKTFYVTCILYDLIVKSFLTTGICKI